VARDVQRSMLPIPDLPDFGLVAGSAERGDDHSHLIDLEDVVRVAMARQ